MILKAAYSPDMLNCQQGGTVRNDMALMAVHTQMAGGTSQFQQGNRVSGIL